MCYYRLWCAVLFAGCRGSGAGQQAVRPGRGMLHDCSRAASGRHRIAARECWIPSFPGMLSLKVLFSSLELQIV